MENFKDNARRVLISMLSVLVVFSMFLPGAAAENAENSETHKLAIMGTTDIHAHIMPYDYMEDLEDETIGLSKVYSVVEEIREQYDHSLLIDNGDIIQGSILGDIEATVNPREDGGSTIIDVMNFMEYDAAALGNHEFNFGLDLLDRFVDQSEFTWLGGNIYNEGTDEHRYDPYVLIDQEIDGEELTVGVLGFVPPQIMIWDRVHLEGNVYVNEIVETAEELIPQMKAEGADVIVVAAHSGFDLSENASENASYQLSQLDGVDALITGHQHYTFPNDTHRYGDMEGADVEKGTLNGTPTVMPGAWGSHLGLIELELEFDDGEWSVVDGFANAIETADYDSHEAVEQIIMERHLETVEYVNSPVGETVNELNTFFSRVMDNEVVQLVNDAQLDFAESRFEGTEYEGMPLLSAAAPFRAGRGGPGYFTDVRGDIAIKDVADLYIYPNTIHVVKVDGNDLRGWLEESARAFFQIDPEAEEDQYLTDMDFRGYNFDTIEGAEYLIDVTRPEGERIVSLTYNGEPVEDDAEYLVVTNNYRASGGGGHIADAESAEIVYSGTEENREVLIDYIREQGTIEVEVTNNWSIVPFEAEGRILFQSSPEGADYINRAGVERISFAEIDANGWGVYEYHTEEMDFVDFDPSLKGKNALVALYKAGLIDSPDKDFPPAKHINRGNGNPDPGSGNNRGKGNSNR
ncbi:bifunctional 2',3'-cyclic-nucleotide 2'-phosphodiesterase/3'-nucleotidase [Evansella sp. LMS18]|uniref:bifunctional 2',3'-cyclic-nucleotide 2'-phosphodiesterase/3'-nucleotidase n=1 Tax=Evansella sp. LMS18 TaxID=2924033 RepID=UPI0020D0B933|nr:bifunctional 2',3'-cyclic-nucleotide 2'-phosphodiesterase/3'-nucleotidase [Evansella sp. LMS18]UTR11957.1 bifunctional 2',3'-cyclic-nucleotide 2'-phosphodiesterase/3'-nucleotidase [Evansella sp. LMS18]